MSAPHHKPDHEHKAHHEEPIPEPYGEKEVAKEFAPYVMRFLMVGLTLIMFVLLYEDVTGKETPFANWFWSAVKVFHDILEAWAI